MKKLYLILVMCVATSAFAQNSYQTGFIKLFPEFYVKYPNNFILRDNGIVVIGTKDNSMYIAHIDSTNNIVWDKTLKCEFIRTTGQKLTKFSDTTFICLANANEKIFIAKLTNDGDTIWTKSLQIDEKWEHDYYQGSANDLLIDSNNDIIVCGYRDRYFDSYPNTCGFILKLNSSGDSIYYKGFDEASKFSSITESDSGYLVVGDNIMINYNFEGEIVWTKQYGGISVDKTNDNNFLVAGKISGSGYFFTQCHIQKINQNGDTIWTKTFGYDCDNDNASSIKKISDTKYIVVGELRYMCGGHNVDGFYSILNSDGETILTQRYCKPPAIDVPFYYAEIVAEGRYLILGRQGNSTLLLRTFDGGGFSDIKEIKKLNFHVYPNPTTGELRITNYELRIVGVEIYDVMGMRQHGDWEMQNAECRIGILHLPAGIYFVKIITEDGIFVEKIIKN